jgi:4-carboxymuconolactone decarboxylase
LSRLPITDAEMSPPLETTFAEIKASRGWVSNALRSLAHAPEGLRRFQAVGHYTRFETKLTELQRELTILTTGRGVDYAWGHHVPLALQIGLTEEQIGSIKDGRVPSGLAEPDAALCAYVLAFASGKGVNQPTFEALRAHFTPEQITEISITSAYYLGLGAILIAFDVELEPPEELQIELDWQRRKMEE